MPETQGRPECRGVPLGALVQAVHAWSEALLGLVAILGWGGGVKVRRFASLPELCRPKQPPQQVSADIPPPGLGLEAGRSSQTYVRTITTLLHGKAHLGCWRRRHAFWLRLLYTLRRFEECYTTADNTFVFGSVSTSKIHHYKIQYSSWHN